MLDIMGVMVYYYFIRLYFNRRYINEFKNAFTIIFGKLMVKLCTCLAGMQATFLGLCCGL
ncbi:MAG: hypothetical protein ACLTCP_08440 [Ruminococcus bicirculans (ex Wegman et al. 2014)]